MGWDLPDAILDMVCGTTIRSTGSLPFSPRCIGAARRRSSGILVVAVVLAEVRFLVYVKNSTIEGALVSKSASILISKTSLTKLFEHT